MLSGFWRFLLTYCPSPSLYAVQTMIMIRMSLITKQVNIDVFFMSIIKRKFFSSREISNYLKMDFSIIFDWYFPRAILNTHMHFLWPL